MVYSRSSIELLKSRIDPKDILFDIGSLPLNAIKDNGVEIRCPCPLHGGDNLDGFSWKKSEGLWTCFTKGCGEGTMRDVFSFVSLKLGISFIESVKYLASLYHFSLEREEDSEYCAWRKASSYVKRSNELLYGGKKLEVLRELPGYYPAGEKHIVEYLKLRKYFDFEEIRNFNLYPCIDQKQELRLGIPAYDIEGNLVGVNARRLDGILNYSDKSPKYMMVSGYQKSAVLYNLHIAKELSSIKGLVVVEGELSCIRLHTYGVLNSVACVGSCLSKDQASLAGRVSNKFIFLREEGEAALQGVLKSIRNLYSIGLVNIYIASLGQGDADSNSRQAVLQCLDNMRKLNLSELQEISQGKDLL